MTLQWISIRNLMRRKGKAAFILSGLVIGVATGVGILTYVNAVHHDILHKLEQYGANILIVPRTENLALSYGGLALGGVSFELEEIRESELAALASIPNARNIAALGPMVLGVAAVDGRRILMAGVDFSAAGILKPWWSVRGRIPAKGEVLLGYEAARVLNLDIGDPLPVGGRSMMVAGIIEPTGSQDDQLAFTHLADAQEAFNKPHCARTARSKTWCGRFPKRFPAPRSWPSSRWSGAAWRCSSSSKSLPMGFQRSFC